MKTPIVFERGDRHYFVGPVAPAAPSVQDIEEFAFGKDLIGGLRGKAPNEFLSWFAGHYVEADMPNKNGHMWRSGEVALKSLTPMFCPVTVMHDPSTAVGLIADTRLLTPEKDGVPRAKIENALALWRHRFPEAVEEAEFNYKHGTLMNSMECMAPIYDCGECGMTFNKLPGGAEQEQWCSHLKGEDGASPVRILRSVVFTGTGLIYGSRGAEGADPLAHLESFTEEVAEFHQRAGKPDARKPRSKRSQRKMEVDDKRYDELVSAEARLKSVEADLVKAETQVADLTKDSEGFEARAVKAEAEVTTLKASVTEHEQAVNEARLREERFEHLGEGFVAKLGDKTKTRVREQAGKLSDEDWTARLDELEELVGVKRDAKKDGDDADDDADDDKGKTFTAEELAQARIGAAAKGDKAPTPEARGAVMAGLLGS